MGYRTFLTCTKSIREYKSKLRFEAGNKYEVLINHTHLVSVKDKNGYKMNFSTRDEDMNLLYVWDYFNSEDEDLLISQATKAR